MFSTPTYDVFVSYNQADSDWVWGWLVPRLDEARVRVHIDQRTFRTDPPQASEVERAVNYTRMTLHVFSPEYVADEWLTFESLLARDLDPASWASSAVPALLRPCPLPPRIRFLTPLDFRRQERWEEEFSRLLEVLWAKIPPLSAMQKSVEIGDRGEAWREVQLVLRGSVSDFNAEAQREFISEISGAIGAPPDEVVIAEVSEGSVIVKLEMPEAAAQRLFTMYLERDPRLRSMRILKVELRKPTCQRRLSRTVRSTSFAPEDNDTPKPTFAICTGLPKEHAAVHVLLDRARYFSPKGKVPPRTYVVREIPNSKGSKHEIVLASADSGATAQHNGLPFFSKTFPR